MSQSSSARSCPVRRASSTASSSASSKARRLARPVRPSLCASSETREKTSARPMAEPTCPLIACRKRASRSLKGCWSARRAAQIWPHVSPPKVIGTATEECLPSPRRSSRLDRRRSRGRRASSSTCRPPRGRGAGPGRPRAGTSRPSGWRSSPGARSPTLTSVRRMPRSGIQRSIESDAASIAPQRLLGGDLDDLVEPVRGRDRRGDGDQRDQLALEARVAADDVGDDRARVGAAAGVVAGLGGLQDVDERRGDGGVELRAGAAAQLVERDVARQRAAVGTVAVRARARRRTRGRCARRAGSRRRRARPGSRRRPSARARGARRGRRDSRPGTVARMRSPITGCSRMSTQSAASSGPGLCRSESGMPIFPTSWSSATAASSAISWPRRPRRAPTATDRSCTASACSPV